MLISFEAKPFIDYLKENGCVVIHKCTSIRHAKVSNIWMMAVALHRVHDLPIEFGETWGRRPEY